MTYLSPFTTLFESQAQISLKYNGTLEDILSEIIEASQENESVKDKTVLALHPPRIIRALVDYKIARPEDSGIEELLIRAIEVALRLYSDASNSQTVIENFKEEIKDRGQKSLLSTLITQTQDSVTWRATDPKMSQETAKLIIKGGYKELLFIALAQGGVAAGMDVFLNYCNLSGNNDSAFYTVRFSRNKHQDEEPRLSSREIDYLKKLAGDRQIIIFDEDRYWGYTLDIAKFYFSKILNLNILSPRLKISCNFDNIAIRGKFDPFSNQLCLPPSFIQKKLEFHWN